MIENSKLWISDIDRVISYLPELDELAGKSVLITGVCGLICSSVVDLFLRYNETHQKAIQILAAARSEEKTAKRFGEYLQKEYMNYVPYDAEKECISIDGPVDYIIHGASNASPNKIMAEPVETMVSNFTGLLTLLKFAKTAGTKRILFISSSEVYGKKTDSRSFREDEYGYINLLEPRNSYSIGKRAAETLCASFAREYEMDVTIVRPGHIYGPTALKDDNRVSSAWAFSAARGEDIVMKSDGAQIRSYCYCLDCASAIIKVLMKGNNSAAYNISNPNSIASIRGIAEMLAASAGVKVFFEKATEKEKSGFNPMSNSSLDSTALQALGWNGLFDAPTGIEHTVKIIQEIQ